LKVQSGDVSTASSATNFTYNPFCEEQTITIPTSVCHLDRGTFTLKYGNTVMAEYDGCNDAIVTIPTPKDPCNECLEINYGGEVCELDGTRTGYTPCSGGSITVPTKLSDINYSPLTIKKCGDEYVYDPGSNLGSGCTNSAQTIDISEPNSKLYIHYGDISDAKVDFDVYNPTLADEHYPYNGFDDSGNPIVNESIAVDLGRDGILWSTTNVGANDVSGYGDYYKYGSGVFAGNGPSEFFSKNRATELSDDKDSAVSTWGGKWRMPTKSDFEWLVANTTKAIAQVQVPSILPTPPTYVTGVRFTSNINGKSIFIPFAGKDSNAEGIETSGFVWSRTCHNNGSSQQLISKDGYALVIYQNDNEVVAKITHGEVQSPGRLDFTSNSWLSIRPVYDESIEDDCIGVSKGVTIPTCVSHLKRESIKFVSGTPEQAKAGFVYDPGSTCSNQERTVAIPTSVCHLDRGKVTFKLSGDSGVSKIGEYDGCENVEILIPKPGEVIVYDEELAYKYGSPCASGASDGTYRPSQSGRTIVIPKHLGHIPHNTLAIYTKANGNTPILVGNFDVGQDCSSNESAITISASTLTINTYSGGSSPVSTYSFNPFNRNSVADISASTLTINTYSGGSSPVSTYSFNPFNRNSVADINASTLTIHFKGCSDEAETGITYNPFNGNIEETINVGNCGGGSGKLKFAYGNPCTHNTHSGTTSGSHVYTPDYSGNFITDTYASGSCIDLDCNSRGIIIPRFIEDVTNNKLHWSSNGKELYCDGKCLQIDASVCISGSVVADSFFSKSDRRLKENISNLDSNDISNVNKIDFKSFNFKDDESKTKTYGVIAQDVQDAGLSNIVHTDDGGMLNVDYISLLLLKIASMEKTIKDLSTKVDLLTNRLNFGK
jgi:hypothetical protein